MRLRWAVVLAGVLAFGCTPSIPVKDDFGVSALVPPAPVRPAGASRGDIPPEFTEFNAYDPSVNQLLAEQLCATPYQPLEGKALDAVPGRLVQLRGRCRTHIPFFGE